MRLSRCESTSDHGPALDYNQYFEGITHVISRDDYGLLAKAVSAQLARDISLTDIKQIFIYAEKHGSDYHPARIKIILVDTCVTFVMNVAITARGKERLYREFDVLQYLNGKYDFSFLPQPYFQVETSYTLGPDESGEASFIMFLADWFDGYHEFHPSIDKEDGTQKLVLWDTEKVPWRLSAPQAWQTYSQAARILTLYYDVETFEQIFPWHHAAGDFVVRAEANSIDVRLVSARQYAPMIEPSEEVSVYDGLLFFLLNMSVRMRLDRLDGAGEVAWADDECVDATLQGFFQGLTMKEREGVTGAGFVDRFLEHAACLAKKDLSDRFHALVDAYDQAAPDIPVIKAHLERHISQSYTALQSVKAS